MFAYHDKTMRVGAVPAVGSHGEIEADAAPEAARSVILIDPDRARLNGLRAALRETGLRVTAHQTVAAALQAIATRPPDLVVVALCATAGHGLPLLVRLHARRPALPVLALQPAADATEEAQALELGADDVLRADSPPALIAARLRAALRRATRRAGSVAQKIVAGPLHMDPDRQRACWQGAPVPLTGAEFALLASLAAVPGHVKSRDQLLAVLPGETDLLDPRSVDGHVKRLRAKMRAVDPGFAALRTRYGLGYAFEPPRG
jgi:two-component system response regulator ChvI